MNRDPAALDVTLEKDGARRRWAIAPGRHGGSWIVTHERAMGVELTRAKLQARRQAFLAEINRLLKDGWHLAPALERRP